MNQNKSKLENSVINITQTLQSPPDQSQFNDCAGNQSPSANHNKEPQFSSYDKITQNTDNLRRRHTSQSGKTTHESVVLIGYSVIKSIVPQKLSRKKEHKFTYPGKTAEEIDREIRNKSSNIEASHACYSSLWHEQPNHLFSKYL